MRTYSIIEKKNFVATLFAGNTKLLPNEIVGEFKTLYPEYEQCQYEYEYRGKNLTISLYDGLKLSVFEINKL